jgi:hypothetical protein
MILEFNFGLYPATCQIRGLTFRNITPLIPGVNLETTSTGVSSNFSCSKSKTAISRFFCLLADGHTPPILHNPQALLLADQHSRKPRLN